MDRARSAGPTARSAASDNPISRARNGSWRPRIRRTSPVSRRSTGISTPIAICLQGGIPGDIRRPGGTRCGTSTPIRTRARIASSSDDYPAQVKRIRPMIRGGRNAPPPRSSRRSRCQCSRSASGARSIFISTATSSGSSAPAAPRSCSSSARPISTPRSPTIRASCSREVSAAVLRLLSEGAADLLSRRAGRALFRYRRRPLRERAHLAAAQRRLHAVLSSGDRTGSVSSLNDGGLRARQARRGRRYTEFVYPDPGWRMGVVGFGPDGPPNSCAASSPSRPRR